MDVKEAIATDSMLLAAADVAVEAAAGERATPTISIVAYGGDVMTVPGWGPVAIDLAGLDADGQIPLLADHDARVGGVVGHGAAVVRDGRLVVTGVVSGAGVAARQIIEMSQAGFAFQASVAVEPIEHERVRPGERVEVNGRSLSAARGFTLVKRGRLREVSITPVGADAGTSVAIAAGAALVVLGYAITGLAKVMGVLAVAVTAVGTALKLLGAVLAFLVSPIGLVITAVVALGAYILYATGAGAKALGWLAERFETLREDAVASYQGIADALAAGDITLAAKILWLTLKMEWTRGINFLEKAWLNFRNFFIKIGYDAWHGLLAVVEIVWHALEVGWIETTAFLSKTWTQFTGWVTKAWHWCGKQLSKAWNWIRKQFDSSFDAEAANRAEDEYYEARKADIERETGQKLAEREERRQQERERATRVHEATMAEIGRENLQKHQELDTEYQERMAENEADLAKARKEWQDALAEARRKREAKEAEGPAPMEGPEDLLAKVRGSMSGLGDLLQTARERAIGVAGTFNAAALLGLQAGGADDRIANATERTAKGVEGLRQDVRNNRAAFA